MGKGTPCNRARVFVRRLSASVGVLGWRADSQHSLAFVPLYSGLRSRVQIPLRGFRKLLVLSGRKK